MVSKLTSKVRLPLGSCKPATIDRTGQSWTTLLSVGDEAKVSRSNENSAR